jgi:hypothetical protein
VVTDRKVDAGSGAGAVKQTPTIYKLCRIMIAITWLITATFENKLNAAMTIVKHGKLADPVNAIAFVTSVIERERRLPNVTELNARFHVALVKRGRSKIYSLLPDSINSFGKRNIIWSELDGVRRISFSFDASDNPIMNVSIGEIGPKPSTWVRSSTQQTASSVLLPQPAICAVFETGSVFGLSVCPAMAVDRHLVSTLSFSETMKH